MDVELQILKHLPRGSASECGGFGKVEGCPTTIQPMECRCGHCKTQKHGKMPNGHQRYFCRNCKQTFSESFDTLYYYRHIRPQQIDQVLQAHSEGTRKARH